MNFCYLHEKLEMPWEKVEPFLLSGPCDYLNLDTKEWSNISGDHLWLNVKHTTDRVIPEPEDWYDEYTNIITSISWLELREYLHSMPKILNIFHAAFLLDISIRNGITLSDAMFERISSFRASQGITSVSSLSSIRDIKSFYENRNEAVWIVLNLLTKKNAFVRV